MHTKSMVIEQFSKYDKNERYASFTAHQQRPHGRYRCRHRCWRGGSSVLVGCSGVGHFHISSAKIDDDRPAIVELNCTRHCGGCWDSETVLMMQDIRCHLSCDECSFLFITLKKNNSMPVASHVAAAHNPSTTLNFHKKLHQKLLKQ